MNVTYCTLHEFNNCYTEYKLQRQIQHRELIVMYNLQNCSSNNPTLTKTTQNFCSDIPLTIFGLSLCEPLVTSMAAYSAVVPTLIFYIKYSVLSKSQPVGDMPDGEHTSLQMVHCKNRKVGIIFLAECFVQCGSILYTWQLKLL